MAIHRRRFLQYLLAMQAGLLIKPTTAATSQRKRIIPSSGEALPLVGLGSWLTFGIDPENSRAMKQREAVLNEFLRRGGGMLDSSPMYGNAQDVIGRNLKLIDNQQGLFSATKVWTHGNRAGLLQMEESRLLWGLPQLDLMQVHNLMDWQTHLPNLQAMKRRGDIRYIGVTTSHGRRHDELIKIMKTQSIDFVQFTYNVIDREAEDYLLPLAADKGVAVIINRPYQRGGVFEYIGNKALPVWAAEIDCHSWAQFCLKFVISHPSVTCAIPATTRVDHLQENMQTAYGQLPDQAMRKKMAAMIDAL